MIMLLSFFACLTSLFTPVSDSVEMSRFVTFATCHVTTNGSPFSSRQQTSLWPTHSTLPPVALLKIGRLAGRGRSGRSSASLTGQDVKPDPESNNAYSAPSKLATIVTGLCIATGQHSSLCVSAVVLFLGGFDHMEVDEQDRKQVDSERESRGARGRGKRQSKETTNAQTCDDMCMSDFAHTHTLRHLEPQCDVCTKMKVSRKSLV